MSWSLSPRTSTCRCLSHALSEHLLARWEDDDGLLKILLRTAVTDDDAADRVRSIFAAQLTPLVAGLGNEADVATRAGLVATQALGSPDRASGCDRREKYAIAAVTALMCFPD